MSYRTLIEQLVSSNLESQIAARMAILAQQENAVEPLVSVYSGGVTDAQGLAVLDILA
jgi:hypothetical protein